MRFIAGCGVGQEVGMLQMDLLWLRQDDMHCHVQAASCPGGDEICPGRQTA
jgi:hypothetical protein